MRKHLVVLCCLSTLILGAASCREGPSFVLSPIARTNYHECDDPSQCEPGPGDPPPPTGDYVEYSYCAECVGAPNIESTRAVAEVDYRGFVNGIAIMNAWGNSYLVTMKATATHSAGGAWESPTVSDGYSSGLLTIDGSSTSFQAKSPIARIATNKQCGVMASGSAEFHADIRKLDGSQWRSSIRVIQAPIVYQTPCPGDPPVYYDQSKSAGIDRMQTDEKVCWDRYYVNGDSWTYMYTWCT